MQNPCKDYYDIPDDELPSANFAARPTSEISELGLLDTKRLWGITICTSSRSTTSDNEGGFDDGPTPTAATPDAFLMPQPEMPALPPDTPHITVTAPSRRQSLRQRLRSVGDVASIMRRPSLRHKAETAPHGAYDLAEYAPQVPRRAMSARLEKRDAARVRHSRHLSSESDLKARRVLGVDDTLPEERIATRAYSSGDSDDMEQEQEMELSLPKASFSRKPRVRETLEKKQMTRLRMDFVGPDPTKFVDSPQSMLGTPVELYAIPERQPGRFRPTSAIHGRRGSSTPVSPRTPSPYRRPRPRPRDGLVDDEDVEGLYKTRVYVPGPLCLEKHPALLRKDSVATLDPFASEIDSVGRRPSDFMALEQIVVYFDGMGLNNGATDECLDRYWLDEQQQAAAAESDWQLYPLEEGATDECLDRFWVDEDKDEDKDEQQDRQPEGELGVMELDPSSPRSQGSQSSSRDAGSRFSFSSASSGASVQRGSPQKRQLIRLRRLLSPALPGLKSAEGEGG